MSKKLLSLVCLLSLLSSIPSTPFGTSPVYARPAADKQTITQNEWERRAESTSGKGVSEKAADWWWVFWTGIGSLGDWTISNTIQGGIFSRPPSIPQDERFDGSQAQQQHIWQYTTRGMTGEYPRGSRQYYVYAAGPWFGAERKYPGIDTTWYKVVSKAAYYSDIGAMYIPELSNAGEAGDIGGVGMSFSDQVLPTGYGHAHEGEDVFSQGGVATKEEWQALWPFADTLINKRRTDQTTYVYPDSGSIISQEDTYASGGDWIPEKDACCIWVRDAGKYDVRGLGIRIEQRTYSWNYAYNNSYIYMNWKIRNMTDDILRNLYVGYLMDNDIGSGGMGTTQGCEDDLIGYDTTFVDELGRHLDLGYTYDSDGYEPGWTTAAGYIGCVLLQTPADTDTFSLRMKGFQYWQRVGDVGEVIDNDMQDSVKYMVLGCKYPERDSFMVASAASDMRQLCCSGCKPVLLPQEEVEFTLAIVAAYTFDELKEKAISAIKQFQYGYLGYSPPPSPKLSVTPGDSAVFLSWDASPETYYDKMAKAYTFEGYKCYRSLTGLPDTNDWDLLATFDKTSSTVDTVVVKYTIGTSKAMFTYEGKDAATDSLFLTNRYTICFANSYYFTIHDSVNNSTYSYNKDAKTKGSGGYCIMNSKTGSAYSTDPGYVSGAFIYMDGFFVKLQNGELDPDNPGVSLIPVQGDEFSIRSYRRGAIGHDTQLEHFAIDRNVVNGKKYYYSVTSFSKPIPEAGIPSLESGLSGKAFWAIPMKNPPNYTGAQATFSHSNGLGDIDLAVTVANPAAVKNDSFLLYFISDTFDINADAWVLKALSTGSADTFSSFDFSPLPSLFNGLDIKLAAIARIAPKCDTANSHWLNDLSNWSFSVTPKLIGTKVCEPYYDYKLTMSSSGSYDLDSNKAPFILWNTNLNSPAYFRYSYSPDSLADGDLFYIYNSPSDPTTQYHLQVNVYKNTSGSSRPPKPGCVFYINILNRLTPQDTFKIFSYPFDTKKDKYSLDNIRVVPNPYFVRASWDRNKVDRKIWFQGLPSQCTIRIFNIAGLLVKTIEHNELIISPIKVRSESSGPGAHAWNFSSDEGTDVASGLYIYQVVTPDKKHKVGKFAIVK